MKCLGSIGGVTQLTPALAPAALRSFYDEIPLPTLVDVAAAIRRRVKPTALQIFEGANEEDR